MYYIIEVYMKNTIIFLCVKIAFPHIVAPSNLWDHDLYKLESTLPKNASTQVYFLEGNFLNMAPP